VLIVAGQVDEFVRLSVQRVQVVVGGYVLGFSSLMLAVLIVARRRSGFPRPRSSSFRRRADGVIRRRRLTTVSGVSRPRLADPGGLHSLHLGEGRVRADVVIVGRRGGVEVGVQTLTVVGSRRCRQTDLIGRWRKMDGEDHVVDVGRRRAAVWTIAVFGDWQSSIALSTIFTTSAQICTTATIESWVMFNRPTQRS